MASAWAGRRSTTSPTIPLACRRLPVKAGADEWREYLRIYGKKSVRVVREKTQDLRKRARAGRVQALRGDKTMKQLSLFS